MSEVSEGLRAKQRLARDSDILEAAWALLSEKGYSAWTLADLADRAGVSRRTLYLHFASKEEIAAETVARNLTRNTELLRGVAAEAEPLERLKAVVRWFVGRNAAPKAFPVDSIKAEPGLMAAVRTFPSYQTAQAGLTAALAELIAAAQSAGAITRAHSPSTLAALLFQLLRGIDVSRWTDAEELDQLVVKTLFHGIGDRE